MDGSLKPIYPSYGNGESSSLFEQFPLVCDPSSLLVEGERPASGNRKVFAYRSFLRVSRSGRSVVHPDMAEDYFSFCRQSNHFAIKNGVSSISTLDDVSCSRASLPDKIADANEMAAIASLRFAFPNLYPPWDGRDLYNKTPYFLHEQHYMLNNLPRNLRKAAVNEFHLDMWTVHSYEQPVALHKFRWHTGSLDRMKLWLERYKGTCDMSKPEIEECHPLILRWKKGYASLKRLNKIRRVDIRRLNCTQSPSEHIYHVNTSHFGKAWEQFEPGLMVKPKIRDTSTGDSQSRQMVKDKIISETQIESDGY